MLLRRHLLRVSREDLERSLEALLAFLRSEIFAVATYEAAIRRILDPCLRNELTRLRNSHHGRVFLLRERIEEFGGAAQTEAEPWGAFACVLRKVEDAVDERDALAALCEGERWGVRDYETDLGEVEPHLRDEIAGIVLTEQRRTAALLERLLGDGMGGSPIAHPA